MMARFSADQAVLQSEQSQMLVPREEVCKIREILAIFCIGWLLQAQNCRASTAEGHCTTGWAVAAHPLACCQR